MAKNDTATRLFAQAELRAERTAASLRILASLLLVGVLVSAVLLPGRLGGGAQNRQIVFALLILGGYLSLGVASLSATRPAHFRPWMPWLFVTCDVAFIIANVMLNVINADMDARFVAALPVVWLTPVVLALMALRYSPLLLAYGSALLLMGFAASSLVAGSTSDREFAATFFFLFDTPPNGIRLIMLGLAAAILTTAVARCRANLLTAIDETRRRTNLVRFLPPEIADRLSDVGTSAVRQGRRQPAAILFVDMREFTRRAETMDATALGQFIADFRRRMMSAATAHHGVVDKFIGDAVMVVFGLPEPGPADARHALQCGMAMLGQIRSWNKERGSSGQDEIRVAIGVHFGEVFCGAIGDEGRLEFTVVGDPVNDAARIEGRAKEMDLPLIVSADLLAAARTSSDDWVALPEQPLRGRQAPIQLFAPKSGKLGAGDES